MEKESVFTPEVQGQEKALALLLAQEVERWYLKKYGKPYEWKTVNGRNLP